MTEPPQSPAPVAGRPLTAESFSVGDYAVRLEDHPLVKAGEVHQVVEMFRGGFLGFAKPIGGEWDPKGWRKCDTDGWMPWSGGENPVPGQMVEVKLRWRNGEPSEGEVLSDRMAWAHRRKGHGEGGDIIAFRLSRPASEQPVEAIGAGREEVARIIDPQAWGAFADEQIAYVEKHNLVHSEKWFGTQHLVRRSETLRQADAILALSPAPPARTPMGGEVEALREALERIADAAVTDEVREDYRGRKYPFRSCDPAETVDVARQALAASSPSPAQGGGYIGTVEVLENILRSGGVTWLNNEQEWALKSAIAALAASPQPEAGEAADWSRDLTAAPEGEAVLLATSAGHVGEAIAPVRDDPDDDWFWAGAGFVHANHKPVAWKRLPTHPDAPPSVQPVEVK